MKPFFSIIIPTLNEESYLPKLLRSLLKQTLKDFEIIIVDSMSDDATVEKAELFRSRFEKHLVPFQISRVSERNVSFQRNFGAGLARGPYFIFFDADVQVPPDFLKKLKKHIQSDGSVLITTWLTADDDELINELFMLIANYGIDMARYTNKPYLPGFNIIVERNIFSAIGGFIESIKLGEDLEFARIAHKKGVHLRFLHEPKLQASLRRFRSEGRMNVWKDSIRSLTRTILKGPITDINYEYPMGGAYHNSKKAMSVIDVVKEKLGPHNDA